MEVRKRRRRKWRGTGEALPGERDADRPWRKIIPKPATIPSLPGYRHYTQEEEEEGWRRRRLEEAVVMTTSGGGAGCYGDRWSGGGLEVGAGLPFTLLT